MGKENLTFGDTEIEKKKKNILPPCEPCFFGGYR